MIYHSHGRASETPRRNGYEYGVWVFTRMERDTAGAEEPNPSLLKRGK